MSMNFLRFPIPDLDSIPSENGAPAPERLVSGNPVFRTWTLDARDNDTLFSGVWESTPGKWRISYDEWEFCSILSGRSIITHEDGREMRVAGGDAFIIEPGFRGWWETIETTRKIFVVRLPLTHQP
jgi:uncharacterized cupin superfamily protein